MGAFIRGRVERKHFKKVEVFLPRAGLPPGCISLSNDQENEVFKTACRERNRNFGFGFDVLQRLVLENRR